MLRGVSLCDKLEYKVIWRGKTIIKIDQWFPSSQICSNCGASTGKKPLNIREVECPECHTKHDRDINEAVNIRNYGLGQIDNRNTAGTAICLWKRFVEFLKYPSKIMAMWTVA